MKRSRLNPVSDKRRKQNVEYEAAKKKWRAGHDGRCEVMVGWSSVLPPQVVGRNTIKSEYAFTCLQKAMPQPHHIAFRGKLLSDPKYFLAVCPAHHRWIHDNAKEAERLGYLVRPRNLNAPSGKDALKPSP